MILWLYQCFHVYASEGISSADSPFSVITLLKKLRKWFEPRSSIPSLKKIIWVIGVLRRTVVSD